MIFKHIEPSWVSRNFAFDVGIDTDILLAEEQKAVVAYGGYNVKLIMADGIIHADSTLLSF